MIHSKYRCKRKSLPLFNVGAPIAMHTQPRRTSPCICAVECGFSLSLLFRGVTKLRYLRFNSHKLTGAFFNLARRKSKIKTRDFAFLRQCYLCVKTKSIDTRTVAMSFLFCLVRRFYRLLYSKTSSGTPVAMATLICVISLVDASPLSAT